MNFKHIIIASTLAALVSTQSHAAGMIGPQFGAKLGANFSKFTGTAVPNSSFGFGFGIGPMLVIDIAPMFAFATELTLNRKAYGTTTQTTKVWDMNIPLMARYKALPMLFVQGGANISFGMGSTSVTPKNGVSSSVPYYNALTSTNGIGRTDFGFVLGAGSVIPVPTGGDVQVEGRLAFGLKDRNPNLTLSQKTVSFELSAGYLF